MANNASISSEKQRTYFSNTRSMETEGDWSVSSTASQIKPSNWLKQWHTAGQAGVAQGTTAVPANHTVSTSRQMTWRKLSFGMKTRSTRRSLIS